MIIAHAADCTWLSKQGHLICNCGADGAIAIPRVHYEALMAAARAFNSDVPIALGWKAAKGPEIEAAFQSIRDCRAALRAAGVDLEEKG